MNVPNPPFIGKEPRKNTRLSKKVYRFFPVDKRHPISAKTSKSGFPT